MTRTVRTYIGSIFASVILTGALCMLGTGLVLTQELSIKVLVNDDPISDYDISQRERFLALTTQKQPGPELKKEATELLIDERLQMQEGRKVGVTADEDSVNNVLGDMASKNNLDVQGLTTALAGAGVNVKTLKDRIRAQLVWQSVVSRKFRHMVQIGDVEVDRALSESSESEGAEATLQLRQVRFALPSNADQRTIAVKVAEAEALRARFNNCSNITDLAKGDAVTVKSLPDHQTSALTQPARLLVQNAKIGQMTPPALTQSGVELYALCGKRNAPADTNLREMTQRKLMNEEMLIHAEKLLRDLRQDAFVEYR